jgi:hypothetical protein
MRHTTTCLTSVLAERRHRWEKALFSWLILGLNPMADDEFGGVSLIRQFSS